MSGSLCNQVERFSDGMLLPAQAERFRGHAARCASCQHDLADLAQLHVLETRYRARLKERAERHLRWRWGATVALAAMLGWALAARCLGRL